MFQSWQHSLETGNKEVKVNKLKVKQAKLMGTVSRIWESAIYQVWRERKLRNNLIIYFYTLEHVLGIKCCEV